MKVKERFLRYAATDTASEPDSPKTPSTDKQRVFAEMLCDELRGMGAEDVKLPTTHTFTRGFRQT